MPDEFDEVADRLYKRISDDLRTCQTDECKRAQERIDKAYKEGDVEALKEVRNLRGDIGKLLEEIEKVRSEPVEPEECPNCHYKGSDKPEVIGSCPNGCTRFNKYDKELGYKHCVVCGDEIDWEK